MGLLGSLGGIAGTFLGGPVGGAIGGLLGGSLDGNETTNGGAGTTTKSPWAPAAPYLTDNLARNQQMQNFYAANPFNAQQKTAYQNTFSDLDNLRNNVMPGVMQFANNAMTGSYQRPSYSRPGMAGYGDRSLNQSPGAGLGNVFSAAPGQSYSAIDWNANDPFKNGVSMASAQPTPTTAQPTAAAIAAAILAAQGGDGNYSNPTNSYGSGGAFSNVNDAFNSIQGAINTPAGAGAAYAASLLGLLGPIGQHQANVPVTDLSTYSPAAMSEALGGWSPSYGDSGTADSPGGSDMGGYGGADNGYAKGGGVTKGRLKGEDPEGPDDGYAALDAGEYVVKASSVKKYGKGLLDDINAGTYKKG